MSEEIALDAVGQRYQLNGEVGRGGMSVVYAANDPRIGRKVAIKLLHPHLATREDARRRFLQEAKAIALLENPNILKIYDYDSPDGAASYIVSEFIEGVTLKAWIEEHPIKHWEIAALIAIPLFRALAHAHDHGVIHRDVKPENMMIRARNGSPVLMDFGIAHMVDSETLTATGAVIGSPAHMAPEVVNGERLTAQADLFSMGTVLYWMVCGALPFVAPNPAALFRRILEARFDPVHSRRPDVLPSFAELIERCMKREPSSRPQGASVIVESMERLLCRAGLDDITAELLDLSKDPSLYQESLPSRLAPHYCQNARQALVDGELALGIELAQRALLLDPQLEEAERVYQEAQRALRAGESRRHLWLSVACLPLSAGLFFSADFTQLEESVDQSTIEHVDSKTHRGSISNPPLVAEENKTGQDPNTLSPQSPPKRLKSEANNRADDPTLKTKAPSPSPRKNSEGSRKAPTSKISKKTLDKPRVLLRAPSPKQLTRRSIKSRVFKKKRPKKIKKTKQRVDISSMYKGVNVQVDGEAVGHIYEIDRAGGLDLSLGDVHEIVFTSPFCKRHREVVRYKERQNRPPRLVFECQFKPATFLIKSDKNAEVFLNGSQPRRLGITNQKITYPLRATGASLSLLIVGKDGRGKPLTLKVAAGQYQELAW